MNIVGIIPARFASTRFPGKPLVDIKGKPMIQRVYEQASKSKYLNYVCVATDNSIIHQRVLDFGGNSILTSENHPSGTDRVFEAATKLNFKADVVVNIQGDEPFIDPCTIDSLAALFKVEDTEIASMACPITDYDKIHNADVVKVILDKNNKAIYFSRFPVPYLRSISEATWLKENSFYQHIGIYAYRFETLAKLVQLPVSKLEMAESLEQLRWIENGFPIQMAISKTSSIGIDTHEDLQKALNQLIIND